MKEETHNRDQGDVMTKLEVGVMQPQVKECRQPSNLDDSPLEPYREDSAADTSFGLLSSRTVEE